ncbi:hypothetical protein NLX86_18675 [Streptomyces sp. A3M-1-3]|uniref:hypothetical protein n=1 Tax=Streptomyces sp. A3M-1-3 TaxID=2962044 RepID=UPI0020B873EC|nr:hypothetical protein [Streptomyces sp. A3M-1-3]MCP3820042.1 hypothetical protein [Streptomyces sp. A3M-1-3]
MPDLQQLPAVAELSERQIRGTACVYCAVALDNATAVDLTPRWFRRAGQRVRWFPRACPAHKDGQS